MQYKPTYVRQFAGHGCQTRDLTGNWSLRTAALLSLVAVSCTPADEPELGDAWVVVGAGEESYSELVDEDEVPIVQGPQGGFMIALSLQAGGVVGGDPLDPTKPANPRATFQAFPSEDPEAAPLGSITVVRGLTPIGGKAFELLGTWLIFDPSLPVESYFDTDMEIVVTLVDTEGDTASDSVAITALAPLEYTVPETTQ